jgi:hypothetical protein
MSGVFQNIDPPTLSPPGKRVPPPPLVRGGGHTRWGRRGCGVNILEDARQYSVLFICKYFEDAIMELTVSKQIQS